MTATAPHRVIWRTPRGTSVEQYAFPAEARRAFSVAVVGVDPLWSVTLWERVGLEWLLTDQFPRPT